ncbi:MAG: acetyl-CoA carboxylase biotin carboxyl carrier protein subunit, partial [Muribaculaceae bacterium]|nr:acetyl-CoA carboxylase biotin carboxyl carrier protein subunit [Muribaculaceae bacterium]
LEAMKMENDVKTTNAGTVKQILVNVGDAVLEGADIMIIE